VEKSGGGVKGDFVLAEMMLGDPGDIFVINSVFRVKNAVR
jgi:hypothetical protein